MALLWFMAVIRRRLGEREDRSFATVYLGSGLACALLTIVAAVCVAAPTLVVHFGGRASVDDSAVAHGLCFGIWGVGASRSDPGQSTLPDALGKVGGRSLASAESSLAEHIGLRVKSPA